MFPSHRRRVARAVLFSLAGLLLASSTAAQGAGDTADGIDLVAVGIVGRGRAILVATPGLPQGGRAWRFRSLDTSQLPQPVTDVALARSGTKLLLQGATSWGVLDLTRARVRRMALEYVDPTDLASERQPGRHTHRLPGQRFVATHNGLAFVTDDAARISRDYQAASAVAGAVTADGTVLDVRPDGSTVVCSANDGDRSECRPLPVRLDAGVVSVLARQDDAPNRASPQFLVLTGTEAQARLVDPNNERPADVPMRRAEAALRACLALNSMSMPPSTVARLVDSLLRESALTTAAGGHQVTDWRFFRVVADAELYAPVLELARLETVFPAPFRTVQDLADRVPGDVPPSDEMLYDRYLRQDVNSRKQDCTLYYHTVSAPGSWMIEYWIYYPFDVGGLGSHVHDPEHMFVEVDKLGSTVRRVIGAGHGYMAGNNVYGVEEPGANGITLPLYALVELGKHATAPDIDRDGRFTPGVDENEYRERAMIWGVRDVVGTINNQLIAYDNTMSTTRRPQDALALASLKTRFPDEQEFAGTASCRLEEVRSPGQRVRSGLRLTDFVVIPPCHDVSAQCAERHVTMHPDFMDVRTILKEWAFPDSFARVTYGIGPGGNSLHTVAVGYAADLDRAPGVGRLLPLPGRVGVDVFYWHQKAVPGESSPDLESCIGDPVANENGTLRCPDSHGIGWALRYEQFLSNLFGLFTAVRSYKPPGMHDFWITFGPFIEAPLGKHGNINIEGGLSFSPTRNAPARFELRVSAGVWKPKTNHVGVRAGSDNGKE